MPANHPDCCDEYEFLSKPYFCVIISVNTKILSLGLMSGTSLDGLDIALCELDTLHLSESKILEATTISYSDHWRDRLKNAMLLNGRELAQLHVDFGVFCAEQVSIFLQRNRAQPEFIASHGHTVFHQPEKWVTLQIGSGAHIAALTGIKTVCDFRTTDIAYGGQGAPLVPVGDRLLFSQYNFCLNIGGFANISMEKEGERIAFDICPANMALNYQTEKLHMPFDENGKLAASGIVDNSLLEKLNQLEYYKKPAPKSLGKEWFSEKFLPLVEESDLTVNDKLATLCEHMAMQIAAHTKTGGKLLITGGGTHNGFLLSRIGLYSDADPVLPSKIIIDHKEAFCFALLGLLRLQEKPNALSSVTGASKNSIGGAVYLP